MTKKTSAPSADNKETVKFQCNLLFINEEEDFASFGYVGRINRKNFHGYLDGFFTGTITTKDGSIETVATYHKENGDMPGIGVDTNGGDIDGDFAGLIKIHPISDETGTKLYNESFFFLMSAPIRMVSIEEFGFSTEAIAWLKDAKILLLDDIIRADEEGQFDEIFFNQTVRDEVKAKLTTLGYYDEEESAQ